MACRPRRRDSGSGNQELGIEMDRFVLEYISPVPLDRLHRRPQFPLDGTDAVRGITPPGIPLGPQLTEAVYAMVEGLAVVCHSNHLSAK
jgi:hypothetical protein